MRDTAQVVRTLRTIHCLLQKLSPTMLRPDEGEDCERADEQVQEKTEPASKEARCSVGVQTEDEPWIGATNMMVTRGAALKAAVGAVLAAATL